MLKITLGETLKRFRIEKNVEAKQVCEGLCSTAMMSYFEKGEKVPDTLLFEYMMERMGVSPELFSIMVSREEYEYYGWKEQVCEAIAERDCVKLGELLASKVAKKKYCNNKLERQFLLYATAIHCGIHEKYEEAAQMLMEAAKQTIPNMNRIGKAKVLLSVLELHILMLYLYYGVLGDVLETGKGKQLFYSLENYVDSERLELGMRAMTYPKLCCIGIQLFQHEMMEREQISLCEKAVELMVRNRSFHEITNVLHHYIILLEKSNSSKLYYYKKQYEVFEDILKTENIDTSFYAESFVVRSPKFYILHEYLLSRRQEMELTQEQLSEGICEPETYSRVEMGRRAPSRKNFKRLAERLDIHWCYYRGELDTCEWKIYELRCAQRLTDIEGKYQESLALLQKMEESLDMRSEINYQYVKYMECSAKFYLNKIDADEAYTKMEELLSITQNLKYNKTQLVYYSQTELEIIGRMAQLLRRKENHFEAIKLIENVLGQMMKSKIDFEYQWGGFSFLLRILAGSYCKVGQHKKAIEIALYVKRIMLKRRESASLTTVLDEIADNLEHLGVQYSEEYKKLYRYTYYVADFFRLEKILKFAKKYYEDNFDSSIEWY